MKSNKLAWVSSLLITLLGLGGAIIFNFIDTNLVSAKIKTIGELEAELQNKYQKFFKKKENEVEPELSREEFKKQYEEKAKSKENNNNG